MAKIRCYVVPRRGCTLPREWLVAIDEAGRHSNHWQGEVLIFAYTRAEATALLTDRGLSQYTADQWMRAARWMRDLPTPWQLAAKAKVIDPDAPGVVYVRETHQDSWIGEAHSDGTQSPVGRFEYESGPLGRGLYVVGVSR